MFASVPKNSQGQYDMHADEEEDSNNEDFERTERLWEKYKEEEDNNEGCVPSAAMLHARKCECILMCL